MAMRTGRAEKTHRKFKNIRNRIGRFDGECLVETIIHLLNHPDATRLERLRLYEPWHLLLLLKWVIVYGNFTKFWGLKPVTDYQFNQLLNSLKDLSADVRNFQSNTDVYLFARNMAFQQFWLQTRETVPLGIARQSLLFAKLEESHVIQKSFAAVTGLPIRDFLELSLALVAFVQKTEGARFSHASFCSWIQNAYAVPIARKFLYSISNTIDDMRRWLVRLEQEKARALKTVDYEYFEPTPFMRFPLIEYENDYVVVFPHLLYVSLSSFVYDTLRAENASNFMNKFGTMFERVVEKSLRSINAEVLTENDLRRHFKCASNQRFVDFLVVNNGCNVFVEAKAVSMSVGGKMTDRAGTVRSQIKDSALKGIRQANDLAEALPKGEEICGVKTGTSDNYLIIVTFKDLYLGNGLQLREFIAPQEVDKIILSSGDKQHIPLSNVFVISIDEIDTLLGNVSLGHKTLVEYLATAVELVESTAAWSPFRQMVFEESDAVTMLPYLQRAWDELTAGLWAKVNK